MIKKIIAIMAFICCTTSSADVIPEKPHIYVEGRATIKVVPDTITFGLRIENSSKELSAAKLDVDERSKKLITICKSLGVESAEISTTPLNIRPDIYYNGSKKVFDGTEVSRQITIKIKKIELYPQVMKALTDANISQEIETTLSVSDEKKPTLEATMAALKDAKSRAESIATYQGKKLGEIYSVSEIPTREQEIQNFQVIRGIIGNAGNEEIVTASPTGEPFEPGTMVAGAVVYVVYLLD